MTAVTRSAVFADPRRKGTRIDTLDGGEGAAESGFTYGFMTPGSTMQALPTPDVTGVSPISGPVEGGTLLRIRGANLGYHVDDIAALYVAGVNCTANIEYVTPTMIRCTTPPGTGTGAVRFLCA